MASMWWQLTTFACSQQDAIFIYQIFMTDSFDSKWLKMDRINTKINKTMRKSSEFIKNDLKFIIDRHFCCWNHTIIVLRWKVY